jgi:hypothetical protein
MSLKTILDRVADTIIANGTRAARPELSALAAAVSDVHPGAAAALVDWEGAEVARERAFAIIRHESVRADAERQLAITSAMTTGRRVALAA